MDCSFTRLRMTTLVGGSRSFTMDRTSTASRALRKTTLCRPLPSNRCLEALRRFCGGKVAAIGAGEAQVKR